MLSQAWVGITVLSVACLLKHNKLHTVICFIRQYGSLTDTEWVPVHYYRWCILRMKHLIDGKAMEKLPIINVKKPYHSRWINCGWWVNIHIPNNGGLVCTTGSQPITLCSAVELEVVTVGIDGWACSLDLRPPPVIHIVVVVIYICNKRSLQFCK